MINIFPFQVKVDDLEALEDVSSNKVMANKILQILIPFTDEKAVNIEPLPGVLGNKGTGAFIFREQGIL